MKLPARFFLMVLSSVAIFVLFASLDEYKNVIAPFFKTKKAGIEFLGAPDMKANFKAVLRDFNGKLSQVYISANPAESTNLPADDNIKRSIYEEIEFLVKNNKVMKFSVAELEVEDVERRSNFSARVKTREIVSVSYLNLSDKEQIVAKQVADHHMIYTLSLNMGRWIVVGMDTVGVEKAK